MTTKVCKKFPIADKSCHPEMPNKKSLMKNFEKTHRKTAVSEYFFNKVAVWGTEDVYQRILKNF